MKKIIKKDIHPIIFKSRIPYIIFFGHLKEFAHNSKFSQH